MLLKLGLIGKWLCCILESLTFKETNDKKKKNDKIIKPISGAEGTS